MDEPPRGVHIGTAGNTLIPCLLVIRAKGYRIRAEHWLPPHSKSQSAASQVQYMAQGDGASFMAESPEALLGLIAMWESRGDDWKYKRHEPDVLAEVMEVTKTYDSEGNEVPEE